MPHGRRSVCLSPWSVACLAGPGRERNLSRIARVTIVARLHEREEFFEDDFLPGRAGALTVCDGQVNQDLNTLRHFLGDS
jgi:hypothetical protein